MSPCRKSSCCTAIVVPTASSMIGACVASSVCRSGRAQLSDRQIGTSATPGHKTTAVCQALQVCRFDHLWPAQSKGFGQALSMGLFAVYYSAVYYSKDAPSLLRDFDLGDSAVWHRFMRMHSTTQTRAMITEATDHERSSNRCLGSGPTLPSLFPKHEDLRSGALKRHAHSASILRPVSSCAGN